MPTDQKDDMLGCQKTIIRCCTDFNNGISNFSEVLDSSFNYAKFPKFVFSVIVGLLGCAATFAFSWARSCALFAS